MQRTVTTGHSEFGFLKEALLILQRTYHWLATWAERNVETDEDGQHVPHSVRTALQSHLLLL